MSVHCGQRRVLITGANGFVGPHLGAALQLAFGSEIEILATSRMSGRSSSLGEIRELDVTDMSAVEAAIGGFQPTHVVNLAGLAAVNYANANPGEAWQVHLHGTLNIGNGILAKAPECVLVNISSGQIYGASARSGRPLNEDTLLAPTNAYEVSKAAADLAVGAMACSGLRGVRLRPFNHTGPGQTEDFALPSFAKQIARIEAGLQPPVLRVGNLDSERDFLDVLDVAAAYARVVARSDAIPAGTVLNVASGVPVRIGALLDRLLAFSTARISVQPDLKRMRPSDTPRMIGDASRARRLLDWHPGIPLEQTLRAVLDNARLLVRAG